MWEPSKPPNSQTAPPVPAGRRSLYRRIGVIGRYIPIIAILGIIMGAGVYNSLNPPPPPPKETPEQVQARNAYQAQLAQLRATQLEFRRNLCRVRAVCATYRTARQECAAAGNIDRCIAIKVGEEHAGWVGLCNSNGTYTNPPKDMPDGLSCFFIDHGIE